MMRMKTPPPAFLACRRYHISPTAAEITLPPTSPPPPFSTLLQSHGKDENPKVQTFSKRAKKTIGDYSSTKRTKMSAKSCFMSILCAVAVLFGVPTSFEGIDIHYGGVLVNNEALALEPTSKVTDTLQSSSTWPPSSTLSNEELFKQAPKNRKYWDSISSGSKEEMLSANEKLIDHGVATISTMYYDSSGGFRFNAPDFYARWRHFRSTKLHQHENDSSGREKKNVDEFNSLAVDGFATRENAVKTLKSIVSSLGDPYSKYLTREELWMELEGGENGFLGLGALVDAPPLPPTTLAFEQSSSPRSSPTSDFARISSRGWYGGQGSISSFENLLPFNQQLAIPTSSSSSPKSSELLSVSQAANLPVITAIIPDSPAERDGLVVGDRIASVGDYQFSGLSRSQVEKALKQKFHAANYFGRADITIAKQVTVSTAGLDNSDGQLEEKYVFTEDGWYQPNNNRNRQRALDFLPGDQILGYKMSHVKSIPTMATASSGDKSAKLPVNAGAGGDAIVHYELITPSDSIFAKEESRPVGYIRLTRFSKSSTAGYINAINSLEAAGAQSYIVDLRNNYGGVIQEAMLTASSLLRDPHSVLCWTLNSRGGFRPQENMEYVADPKYPGLLMVSSESRMVSRDHLRREHPEYLEDGGYSAPTSYASLKELRLTRGIKPAHSSSFNSGIRTRDGLERPVSLSDNGEELADLLTRSSQKKLVLLINEGTASAAEVFASALHDNGRTSALIGTKTFGKGLIQHTFPMPDGGGLRLTVAEYLTPSLQHVTKVGGAKFDSGIKPDIRCESKQGIPQNIGSDLCVGVALDVLESSM